MGWFYDERPGHEGFYVGYIPREQSAFRLFFRELGYPDTQTIDQVERIAVGCECGWRSPHLRAPRGTRWMPYALCFPPQEADRFEELGKMLWRRHVNDCGVVRCDPATLAELVIVGAR